MVAALLAGAGRADHRRARGATRRRPRTCSAGASAPMVLTGARSRAAGAGRQQHARLSSTSRSRSAASGQPFGGFGTHHRPGQRTGRPRARAEGRSAARLPPHRRSRRARAHGRASGASPERPFPAPGKSAYELLDVDRPRRRRSRAVRHGLEHRRSRRRTRMQRRSERLRALDLLVVCRFLPVGDRRARRRRAAERAVGRGGRHDDEPRGARHPAAAPCIEPPADVRTDLDDPRARSPSASGKRRTGSRSPQPRRCSTSCAARARGGPADYSGITYERIDARGRRVLALSRRSIIPGTPRLFAERFPTPSGRARFHAVRHQPPAEDARRRLSAAI